MEIFYRHGETLSIVAAALRIYLLETICRGGHDVLLPPAPGLPARARRCRGAAAHDPARAGGPALLGRAAAGLRRWRRGPAPAYTPNRASASDSVRARSGRRPASGASGPVGGKSQPMPP